MQSAQALSFDDIQGLTYLQVKGTGRANQCPTLDQGASDASALKPGNYKIDRFCMEPTKITVKEESNVKGGGSEFVDTKLVTRLTYTLDQACFCCTSTFRLQPVCQHEYQVRLAQLELTEHAACLLWLPC